MGSGLVPILSASDERQYVPLPVRLLLAPERRGDAQLVHGPDDTGQVLADQLAVHLIPHGGVRLAANAVPKLPLDGTERAFDLPAMIPPKQSLDLAASDAVRLPW